MKFLAHCKKAAALVIALVMIVTLVPIQASAAAAPAFSKTYANLWENGSAQGLYAYTVKNLTKGQMVKWSVSGTGKSYVTLKYTSQKSTGKTVKNYIQLDTKELTAAKNKTVTITAKVYTTGGKLQKTLKTSGKIKVFAKDLTLYGTLFSEDTLYTKTDYTVKVTKEPLNFTNGVRWTVTDETGADVSSLLTGGKFNAEEAGTYTVYAQAYAGSKDIEGAYDSRTITVETKKEMTAVKQTAVNGFQAEFSVDVSDSVKASDFTVTNTKGQKIVPKAVKYSSDGKKVTVETSANFTNGETYTVKWGATSKAFAASVGAPAYFQILTTEVTVNKETVIQYALYDNNDIDVTALYPGTAEYTPSLTNGIVRDGKILMTKIGNTGTLSGVFTPKDTDLKPIPSSQVLVKCVAAKQATDTNFTITTSTAAPDYSAQNYQDNRNAYIGTVGYAHFRALEEDKMPLEYDSITYESSDPDTLIISAATGKITPIRSGSVKIIVKAVYAGTEYLYPYDVTIKTKPALSYITLDKTAVSMSNVYNYYYQEYLNVKAFDQYQDAVALDSETATITALTAGAPSVATYDSANNRVIVRATSSQVGTYSYQLRLTQNGIAVTQNFTVTIQSVPTNGVSTYQLQLDQSNVDLTLDKSTLTGTKTVNLKLAQYKGGVFYSYSAFTVTSISRNGKYYSQNLASSGSYTPSTIAGYSQLPLTVMNIGLLSGKEYICSKAEAGVYTIQVSYLNADTKTTVNDSITLTITDNDKPSLATVARTAATKKCDTALELAQNCIAVTEGTITECYVVGESLAGSKVAVAAGEQYNISSIVVTAKTAISNGATVTQTYPISIGKTLTNGK